MVMINNNIIFFNILFTLIQNIEFVFLSLFQPNPFRRNALQVLNDEDATRNTAVYWVRHILQINYV